MENCQSIMDQRPKTNIENEREIYSTYTFQLIMMTDNYTGHFTACARCFLSNFYFSPNDSPSKTLKDAFYFM